MNNRLEILNANYWEHFKFEKRISYDIPINNPRRIRIQNEANDILKKIHKITDDEKNIKEHDKNS